MALSLAASISSRAWRSVSAGRAASAGSNSDSGSGSDDGLGVAGSGASFCICGITQGCQRSSELDEVLITTHASQSNLPTFCQSTGHLYYGFLFLFNP